MEGKPMSIATRTFGLALTALALMAGEAQAQAGTITDPLVRDGLGVSGEQHR